MATGQAPEAAAKASVFEDFIDIFTSPSEVFQRRMGASVWMQMLVLTVIGVALYLVTRGILMPIFDAEMARAFAKNPGMTADQIEGAKAMAGKIGPIFVAIGIPISMFFTGFILWAVGKGFGAQQTMGDAIMVATYAWVPRVLQFVVAAAMGAMMDASKMVGLFSASLSAGKLLDPETVSRAVYILAGRLDVFILWQTVLLGIGLAVTGKIARTQGYIAAAIVWLIGAGATMLFQR
jgi:hypothetical protein